MVPSVHKRRNPLLSKRCMDNYETALSLKTVLVAEAKVAKQSQQRSYLCPAKESSGFCPNPFILAKQLSLISLMFVCAINRTCNYCFKAGLKCVFGGRIPPSLPIAED